MDHANDNKLARKEARRSIESLVFSQSIFDLYSEDIETLDVDIIAEISTKENSTPWIKFPKRRPA